MGFNGLKFRKKFVEYLYRGSILFLDWHLLKLKEVYYLQQYYSNTLIVKTILATEGFNLIMIHGNTSLTIINE